jgi:hypothetical protein
VGIEQVSGIEQGGGGGAGAWGGSSWVGQGGARTMLPSPYDPNQVYILKSPLYGNSEKSSVCVHSIQYML